MKHLSKEFWDMIEVAKDLGCTVLSTKDGKVKVIPRNRKLPIYTAHPGEKGIHPLRRYLKNTCKLSLV